MTIEISESVRLQSDFDDVNDRELEITLLKYDAEIDSIVETFGRLDSHPREFDSTIVQI